MNKLKVVQSAHKFLIPSKVLQRTSMRSLNSPTPLKPEYETGYNKLDKVDSQFMSGAIRYAENTHDISYWFKKYGDDLTYRHISWAFATMARHNLELDDLFWENIYPVVKATYLAMDRNSVPYFVSLVSTAGDLRLQDNQFWDSFFHKVIQLKFYRYFTLQEMFDVVNSVQKVGRATQELYQLLQDMVLKHISYVYPHFAYLLKELFINADKGSQELFLALEEVGIKPDYIRKFDNPVYPPLL